MQAARSIAMSISTFFNRMRISNISMRISSISSISMRMNSISIRVSSISSKSLFRPSQTIMSTED